MRRSSALLLALLASAGCYQRGPQGELAAPEPARVVVGVEVTNPYGRSIDVYYSTQFLGTLGPYAHGNYTVAPATARLPIYARWSGQDSQRFNLSRSESVRYVYEDSGPDGRLGGRRCTERACS
ncbi:MAG: hypothetical protein ACJ8GN_12960 [Longimicrobiaceae bacterium]